MKSAIIAAVVAALVSSAGTFAAVQISGRAIAPHSIPANRLTLSAVKTFSAKKAAAPRVLAAAVNSTIDYVTVDLAIDYSTADPQTFDAPCPAGDVAVGGGYSIFEDKGGIVENSVTPSKTAWEVVLVNGGTATGPDLPSITVYASCEPAG